MYRKRFGFTHHPLPKNAHGKTFFTDTSGYQRLQQVFSELVEDRGGLGLLTGPAGAGKTAAIRNLCRQLPAPDYRVIYLHDATCSPFDLYCTLAHHLDVRPSPRRAQLSDDIKKTLIHLVDEQSTVPLLIIDDAQYLSDRLLIELSSFLNFAFDSRDLLILWLVGLPALARRLRLHQHAPLSMRMSNHVHLEPMSRDVFSSCIKHALANAGATSTVFTDPALEMLFRASHGLLRLAARLLRNACRLAHQRDHNFVDEHTMAQAIEQLVLDSPTQAQQ